MSWTFQSLSGDKFQMFSFAQCCQMCFVPVMIQSNPWCDLFHSNKGLGKVIPITANYSLTLKLYVLKETENKVLHLKHWWLWTAKVSGNQNTGRLSQLKTTELTFHAATDRCQQDMHWHHCIIFSEQQQLIGHLVCMLVHLVLLVQRFSHWLCSQMTI